jgi:PTH1 family peptidyl-tRNA hydrolase
MLCSQIFQYFLRFDALNVHCTLLSITMTWIIVGLGNPGEEYEGTRHNAGRMAVEYFAKKVGASAWKDDSKSKAHVASAKIGKSSVTLVLPDTFMNKSGTAVGKFVKSAKAAEKVIVVYDDLDLPLGTLKVSFNRGDGGHHGLESIIKSVKSKKFARVRIGVSKATPKGVAKKPEGEQAVIDHILTRFKPAEMEILQKIFKTTSEAIESIVTEGAERAMNKFNADVKSAPRPQRRG